LAAQLGSAPYSIRQTIKINGVTVPTHVSEIFSNKFNPIKIKPSISIDGLSIEILPDNFEYKGKIHEMKESIIVDIPASEEKSYAKIYFVEDLQDNEILIVPEILKQSEQMNEWSPDPQKHKIILLFMHFEVPANLQNLEDTNIFVFNVNLPEEATKII
jgi:hypothetical protein